MIWKVYEKVNGVVVPTPFKSDLREKLVDHVRKKYGSEASSDINDQIWVNTNEPGVQIKWMKEER